MLGLFVLPLSIMVTCKETCAVIIALHKTWLHRQSTIYRIIKNFKESGSIVVKKASGHPRKSSKRQDRLLKLMAAGRCECVCTHSEAKTFGGWPGVKKGSKEPTSLQEKHQGQTDILQKVQGLDC